MDELLRSLLVRRRGRLIPLSRTIDGERYSWTVKMANVAALPSSQESDPMRSDGVTASSTFAPPSRAHSASHNGILPQRSFDGMMNLQSIEDFDLQNPHRQKPKFIQLPVAKTNGEHATRLQHLCDQHGVRPAFTFEETYQQAFVASVEIRLPTGIVKERINEPKASKKNAKEEVCRLAMARMPPVDKMEGIEKETEQKKRKAADDAGAVDCINWVGTLQEYTQRKKLALPIYQECRTEQDSVRWACTVSIVDDSQKIFGSNLGPFVVKQEAKTAAAQAAVEWLRTQGKLLATPTKRSKTNNSLQAQYFTPSTQLVPDVKTKHVASIAQRVHELVASLGFLQPRWESTLSRAASGGPDPCNMAFHDMAAYFDERAIAVAPRLAGPVGKVEQIYGIKNAKEACCEKVLPLLEEIKRSRRA